MQLSKIKLLLFEESTSIAEVFEVGKNKVESISLTENPEQIKISFEKDSGWNHELIPFSSIKTLRYNI